jgi:hypothetical protein
MAMVGQFDGLLATNESSKITCFYRLQNVLPIVPLATTRLALLAVTQASTPRVMKLIQSAQWKIKVAELTNTV